VKNLPDLPREKPKGLLDTEWAVMQELDQRCWQMLDGLQVVEKDLEALRSRDEPQDVGIMCYRLKRLRNNLEDLCLERDRVEQLCHEKSASWVRRDML